MAGRFETAKNLSEIFALLMAGVWAIWIFVYQDRVIPSRVPTHLTMNTKLETVGRVESLNVVKATVEVKNAGNVRAYIVGSIFNVRGYTIESQDTPMIPIGSLEHIKNETGDFMDLLQWVKRDSGQIVNSGRLFPAHGAWLDPSEVQTIEFLSFIPERYELLSVRSEVRLSKKRDDKRVLIDYGVDEHGFARLDIKVMRRRGVEHYNFEKHRKFLDDSIPYRIYSVSSLLLRGAEVGKIGGGESN